MKRLFALLVLSAICIPAFAQNQPATTSSGTNPAPQGRKKRVAILDFDYGTVHSNVAALFGSDIDVGRGITDLLTTYLVKDGTYSVIERKALDRILAEQNFSNSDRANPASAAKMGKLLGVDAIITGSITQFGGETKNTGKPLWQTIDRPAPAVLGSSMGPRWPHETRGGRSAPG